MKKFGFVLLTTSYEIIIIVLVANLVHRFEDNDKISRQQVCPASAGER